MKMSLRGGGRVAAVAIAAAAMSAAGLAYGQSGTTFTITSTAAPNRAGSKAKPARFTPSFTYAAVGADGARATTPISWAMKWNGVVFKTAGFPTCTAATIDEAQSDAGCPKGSFLGKGPTEAMFGPETDKTSNTPCLGKDIKFYNAGDQKLTVYIEGPADQCAGVGYVPPATADIRTTGGTSEINLVWPENITHPLPGLEAALPKFDMQFRNLSRKSNGRRVYLISSVKCSGKRKLTFTTEDAEGTHVNIASLGSCAA